MRTDDLKRKATPENRDAIERLEVYGFKFGVHFGTQNAAHTLRLIEDAFRAGRLYSYLQRRFGLAHQ